MVHPYALLSSGKLSSSDELHRTGRKELIEGAKLYYGSSYQPSLAFLQVVGAIADLESSYGRGWSGEMVGSNNWGAVTCPGYDASTGKCPSGCSPNGDSSPYTGKYVTCFRRYASPAEGAAGILKVIGKWPEVMAAIESGNLDEVSWTMRRRNYYLGFKKDPREASREHAASLETRVRKIAKALGEPVVAKRKGEDWKPGSESSISLGKGALLVAALSLAVVMYRSRN